MNTQSRRYVFIDFDNLRQVKFKKLEKVATRIFLFVEAGHEDIPLHLVQQTQRLGRNLKWILVDNDGSSNLNYHIAFAMGKFHQKMEMDVEFAVVSDDIDFDALVGFINASGRKCLRVKRNKEQKTIFNLEETADERQERLDNHDSPLDFLGNNEPIDVLVEEEIIGRTAEDTIKRLIRSGNRPSEVASLKNYILLHNQELSLHGHIDRIIQKMKDAKDIEIRRGEIIYNF
jgi:hypothetical protein